MEPSFLLKKICSQAVIIIVNFVFCFTSNFSGNGTVEKLKQVFISSGQSYGGLVLNLHSNRLGPAALFQVVISDCQTIPID